MLCCRYEGEFIEGWFHGYGMFWRADGMKYEGQFRGGRIWGLGNGNIFWIKSYITQFV